MKKIIIAFVSIIFITVIGYMIFNNGENKIIYVQANLAVNPENIDEMVEYSDYVFIGTVQKKLGNFNNNDTSIPYSTYQIKVNQNIKDELVEIIEVKKQGGYNKDGNMVLIEADSSKDFLPEVNKQYIFLATAQSDGSLILMAVNGNIDYGDLETKKKTELEDKYKNAINSQDEGESIRPRFKSKYEK